MGSVRIDLVSDCGLVGKRSRAAVGLCLSAGGTWMKPLSFQLDVFAVVNEGRCGALDGELVAAVDAYVVGVLGSVIDSVWLDQEIEWCGHSRFSAR